MRAGCGRFSLLALILILAGCVEREPSEFAPPELGEVRVEAGYDAVHFAVQVKGSWSECGVYFGEAAGALHKVPGERTTDGFVVDVTELEEDVQYGWQAFVSNGREEIRSERQSVTTQVYPYVNIPDPAFKACLVEQFDRDGDGEISRKEAAGIRRIELCSDERNVQSLQGIEKMPNLEVLICPGSWIDKPEPDQPYYYQGHYRWPDCFGPAGTLLDVDVSHNPALKVLNLSCNSGLGDHFETLDLRNNPELEELELGFTYLNYPDVSSLTRLTILNLTHLRGMQPDISRLTKLRSFVLDHPQDYVLGFAVDVSHCPDLEVLRIATARSVSDLSKNPKLVDICVGSMELRSLDVTSLHELHYLDCAFNQLTQLDLSGNPKLRELVCMENQLRTLDVSGNPDLNSLRTAPMNDDAGKNQFEMLYVAAGQEIPGVTLNRSEEYLPAGTKIVVKN